MIVLGEKLGVEVETWLAVGGLMETSTRKKKSFKSASKCLKPLSHHSLPPQLQTSSCLFSKVKTHQLTKSWSRKFSPSHHICVQQNCCCSIYWFVWSRKSLSSVNHCVKNILNELNLIMYQSINSRKQQTDFKLLISTWQLAYGGAWAVTFQSETIIRGKSTILDQREMSRTHFDVFVHRHQRRRWLCNTLAMRISQFPLSIFLFLDLTSFSVVSEIREKVLALISILSCKEQRQRNEKWDLWCWRCDAR